MRRAITRIGARPLHPRIAVALACLAVVGCACAGCGKPAASLEEIDAAVRGFVSDLGECDDFAAALGFIELGDADYVKSATELIGASRDSAGRLLADVEVLQGMRYGGKTAQLGVMVGELCEGTKGAVEELRLAFDGVENTLKAAEPTLLVNLTVPLGMLKEPAEILQYLNELVATSDRSLEALNGVSVPDAVAGYKAFFMDLITNIRSAARDSISLLRSGTTVLVNAGGESSKRVSELISAYPALAEEIFAALKINRLDPLVERVELEINRLYLGE